MRMRTEKADDAADKEGADEAWWIDAVSLFQYARLDEHQLMQ